MATAPTKAKLGVVDPAVLARANHTGEQAIETITGLQDALDAKAATTALPSVGTWTPTLTGTANVASVTAFLCHYTRIGNQVMCRGLFNVTPTAASDTNTTVGVSLPVPSNLGVTTDLTGIANYSGTQRGGRVSADVTNDRATVTFASQGTGALTCNFMFDYVVI
jgi:hypothetical protein